MNIAVFALTSTRLKLTGASAWPGQFVCGELLIQGLQLGNVFVGVQPTLRLRRRSDAADDGAGAARLITALWLSTLTCRKVFGADAVVHVGTHGAMEFMPGKQVGLSVECWPDRLIGELPNIYIYSVNNPFGGVNCQTTLVCRIDFLSHAADRKRRAVPRNWRRLKDAGHVIPAVDQ